MSFRNRLQRFFTSRGLTFWNVGWCALAIAANAYVQVFCRPVPWATITLIIAFTPVLLYPHIHDRLGRWRPMVHFLFGIAACICVYCILFLAPMISGVPLTRWPFVIFSYPPIFLLIQITYHVLATSGSLKSFVSGVSLCVLFAIGMATWFHRSFDRVHDALYDPSKASLVPRNYMTELMLGMHVKYHISFCAYDGWRPPLHDPSIVAAAWLNVPFHPDPQRDLYNYGSICTTPIFFGGERIVVYKSVFPQKAIWQTCSCAIQHSDVYFRDAERGGNRHFDHVPRER